MTEIPIGFVDLTQYLSLGELYRGILTNKERINERELRGWLAGRIFEDKAYRYLRESNPELLNPQDTLNFYKRKYPKNKPITKYGIETSIAKVSVPDGIIIDGEGKIIKIYEYKAEEKILPALVKKFEIWNKQINIWNWREKEGIREGAKIIFVIPDSPRIRAATAGFVKSSGDLAEIIFVPYNMDDLGRDTDNFYHGKIPGFGSLAQAVSDRNGHR